MDQDITNALADAAASINDELFVSQEAYTSGYLNLAAHFLVMSLRASSQGIAGSYSFLEASKSVGSVSQSVSIPQQILDHPVLSMLAKTNYGAKYLALVLPYLAGRVFTVCGATSA
jgi:hypothetical protein